MKKLFSLLILVFSLFLVSCINDEDNDNNNVEEGDEITLNIIGLKGLGTLENPYTLKANQGENIAKKIEITDNYQLIFKTGEIENSKFIEKDNKFGEIERLNNPKDVVLIKTSLDASSYVIMLTATNSITKKYIKVDVEKLSIDNSYKILVIGSSFGEDSATYLYDILHSAGIEDAMVGYMYAGYATLEKHWNNFNLGMAYEKFNINKDGKWVPDPSSQSKTAINKYEWDYISIQQSSGHVGSLEHYYPYLDQLLHGVIDHSILGANMMWHGTWAFSNASKDQNFINLYDGSQKIMFEKIMEIWENEIITKSEFDKMIPVGTVIQGLREAGFGESLLTRDTFHLNLNHGRYAAALMWYRKITGLSLDLVTFEPLTQSGKKIIKEDEMILIKEIVEKAYQNPFYLINKE